MNLCSSVPIGKYPDVLAISISPVRMKVQLDVCPELTREASLFRSDKELIEYRLPAVRVSTPPIAIAAEADDCVMTVCYAVATGLVVIPTPICVSSPPVVASSA